MKIKRVVVGPLQTNCYILASEGKIIVIDPGGDAKKIIKEIEDIEGEVKYIINTHLHFDHVLKNREIEKKTNGVVLKNLGEGDNVKFGNEELRVISTPGHTKESICLLGKSFVISGDLLFLNGHGRVDLPGGSKEEMENTLERVKNEIPLDFTVYPGHGDIFTMEEWINSFFK